MNSYGCEQFREELGDSLDDSLSPAAAEHLTDCDDCRDLRHDARAAARAVTRAGADYVPPDPDALTAKILAALDARAGATSNVVPLPMVEKTAVMTAAPIPSAEVASPTFPEVPAVLPPPAPAPRPLPVAPPRRARTVFALVGAVAAAALAVVALRPGDRPAVPGSTPTADHNPHAHTAWEGTVSQVLRASAERGEGISLQRPGASAWEPVAARGSVPPGSALRTDARTRARVSLADGTVLVLDRATELRFDARAPRTASLVAGNVVADVAHTDTTARMKTAAGDIEVLGTRFALTATADRTTVRVTRGAVRLRAERGDVEVKAGQEGTADQGAAPAVAPAVDLAGSFAWSELGGAPNDTAERGAPGLGELRARRPGNTTERDQAVRLERHAVKVRIVGSVARTEVEEVFRNDTDQTLEGIYRFPLPPEAQVEDLALDVDGRMESGAFVERERAAAIWRGAIRNATAPAQRAREEFVWVPGPWHDPALLEWQRGGRFELRVFPIPARGARRVRIAYTQTVAASSGVRRYTYPLAHDPAGSTRVDQFDVDVQVLGNDPRRPVRATGYPLQGDADGRRMSFSQRGFVPAGDLTVEYTSAERGPLSAWAYDPNGGAPPNTPAEDGYVAFAVRPQLPRWNESRPRDYVLVVDASRSMTGERYARASRLAGAVVSEMDRRDRFTVLACDTRCREKSGGMAPASAEGARDTLRFLQGVEPNGATDLLAQLRAALRTRGAGDADRDLRVVYVGDGVSTAGPRHPERLAAAVGAELAAHPGTVTTVAVGNDVETDTLQAVARVGGGAMVPYVPGESLGGAALGVLEATWGVTLREPEVVLPQGLVAIAPRVLPTLRAGGELRVLARMTAPTVRGELLLRGTVAGQRFESRHPVDLTATRDAGNAFVPRLYAAARVADLDREDGEGAKREAVALSQRFRVPSRHTSLLVLESPAMFRAFGLDRSTAAPAWSAERDAVPTLITGATAGEDESAAAEPSMDDLAGNTAADAPAAAPAPSAAQAVEALGSGRAHRRESGGAGLRGDLDSAPANEVSRESRGRVAAVIAQPARRPPAFDRFPRDPRGGQWMQRVWVRRGTVRAARDGSLGDLPISVVQGIESAREALRVNPDSRDRHRALYRWLSVAGDLDEATQVADRWITRDPMDLDALARKSDALARAGRRDEAVRTLEAMADARPEDTAVLERLATLHERGGDAGLACAWRVSLAEVRPRDAQHLARALRCMRSTGDGALAQRMLDAADVTVREPAERAAFEGAPIEAPVRGDLQVSASWYGGEDLDIALIDPQGARISWQGGRAGVTASGATSPSRESLGVSRASTGEWLVEVVRVTPDDVRGRVTRGEVTVNVLGERRTFSFTLDGARTRVARAAVIRESRLVPANHAPPPGSRIVW